MRIKRSILNLLGVAALLGLAAYANADLARAQELFDQGKSNAALDEVSDVLAANPGDAEARFLQGIIYTDLNREDDAIEVFAGLTQDYPDLPEPYNNLAVLFAQKGDFEKARQSLMEAIQTHPSYSTAHENLGDLYAKMAGDSYDRALTEDEDNESARSKLAQLNRLFSVQQNGSSFATATTTSSPAAVDTAPIVESTPIPTPDPEPVVITTPATDEAVVTATTGPGGEVEMAGVTGSSQLDDVIIDLGPDQTEDASSEIFTMIYAWANAWSAQNADDYVGFYADNFRPNFGMNRNAWERQRRQRVAAPAYIQVGIDDVNITVTGTNSAVASFVQNYNASNYQDRVRKTLTLLRTVSGWQIVKEESGAI